MMSEQNGDDLNHQNNISRLLQKDSMIETLDRSDIMGTRNLQQKHPR